MRLLGCLSVFILIGLLVLQSPVRAQTKDDSSSSSSEFGGKRLDQWLKDMRHPTDASIRHAAIRAVVHFGLNARAAVPNLLIALKEPDPGLRGDAATSLGIIAALDRGLEVDDLTKVVTGLSGLLGAKGPDKAEEQRSVRVHAALALARMGPRANKAIPALADAFVSKDIQSWEMRKTVCYALGRIGIATDSKGPDSKALLALAERLKDSCAPVRLEAIMALSALGPSQKPEDMAAEKKALDPLLNDTDKRVAIWSRVLLMYLDDKLVSEKMLSPICQFLINDPDADIRITAAHAMGTLGGKAQTRAGDLFAAMRDKDLRVIVDGTLPALGMMVRAGLREALRHVEVALRDNELAVRVQAVRTLTALGELADPTAPALVSALQDADTNMVIATMHALLQVPGAGKAAQKPLEDLSKTHKDENIRRAAAETLKILADRVKKP